MVDLEYNTYPGRGVVTGFDETGAYLVQVCWLMGRSHNSRNRMYERDGGRVFTTLAQPDPEADTELTIYNAMDEAGSHFVASNGNHTDIALSRFRETSWIVSAFCDCTYEPDPHHTPRIASVCTLGPNPKFQMVRMYKNPKGDDCLQHYFNYDRRLRKVHNGMGWCITTYEKDGNPLPVSSGPPFSLPLRGGLEDIAEDLWGKLNPQNRVALAVKFIEITTGASDVHIINEYA